MYAIQGREQTGACWYYTSEWLKEVFMKDVLLLHERNGQFVKYKYLKAKCTPSMRIGQGKHEVWVITQETGEVVSAYCSCTAGVIQTCNHVGGLLFRVEDAVRQGYTSPACTSVLCTWNVPKEKTKLEPQKIADMKWTQEKHGKTSSRSLVHPKKSVYQPIDEKSQPSNYSKFDALSSALRISLPNALLHSAITDTEPPCKKRKETPSTEVTAVPLFVLHLLNSIYPGPVLSDDQVNVVQQLTSEQGACDLWKKLRSGRITASRFHFVTGCRKDLVGQILNKDTGPSPNIPALKYGREMEQIAKESYKNCMTKSHTNFKLQNCGLFLDKDNSFMGASPDGLAVCDCCGQGLVEIKCPFSLAHVNPAKHPPPYMVLSHGTFKLNRKHQYYTQVQGQLALTKRSWCDLFVYTSHGHILERIAFDSEFWYELKSNIISFYKTSVVPELSS